MDKELSDAAWRVLPSEFKEEVKKEWKTANNEERLSHDAFLRGCYSTMTLLFGLHNLTSDAEGEEMLTVSRKNVQKMYSYNEEELTKDPTNKGALLLKLRLDALFGSKCLPDNVDSLEPKPAELKYQVNDKVKVKGTNRIGTIIEPYSNDVGYRVYFNDGDGGEDAEYSADELIPYENPKFKRGDMVIYKRTGKKKVVFGMDKYGRYMVALPNMQSPIYVNESDLEPYTEPEEENHIVENHEMVKNFDTILKDGFREHNRLHIAAMAMQGMLSNTTRFSSYEISDLVRISLNCADALISEAEKGDTK